MANKKFIAVDDNGVDKLIKINGKIIEVDLGGVSSAGVERVSTWNEFNTAMGNSSNYGKLYFIEDVDGQDGLGTDESAWGYIVNGSTYKLDRHWEGIKAYIDGQNLLLQNRIQSIEENLTLIEKVWEGNHLGSLAPDNSQVDFDLTTLTDKDGNKFTFASGSKLELDFGISGKSTDHAAHVIAGGSRETYHILSPDRKVDVSFKVVLGTDGHAALTNFNSHGTTAIDIGSIILVGLAQAQPAGTADLSRYQTKLTKTVTLTFDDGTTEDIKVG